MIKNFLKQNIKYFLAYLLLYILNSVFLARFETYERFLKTIGYSSWNDTILYWTVLAMIINVILMRGYSVTIFKNRVLSILVFFMLCAVLSFLWFWISVLPGFFFYVSFGGVLK
jgi:lysylphosphatidylglycerol synthetase-like protein (DUF2156 family)